MHLLGEGEEPASGDGLIQGKVEHPENVKRLAILGEDHEVLWERSGPPAGYVLLDVKPGGYFVEIDHWDDPEPNLYPVRLSVRRKYRFLASGEGDMGAPLAGERPARDYNVVRW